MAKSVRNELRDKLLKLRNSRDFVLCVMSSAKTENNWKELLDIIEEKGEEATADRVALYAITLGEQVE